MSKTHRANRYRGLKWLAIITVCAVIGGGGGVALYRARRESNTAKLLANAKQASLDSRWVEACSDYRMYLRRKPSDMATLKEYAHALEKNERDLLATLGERIRILTRLLRYDAKDVDVVSSLTDLFLQLHEFSRAQDMAVAWQQLKPNAFKASIALAAAKRGLGDAGDAIEVLIAAVNRNPNEVSLYPPLIALHAIDLKDYEQARTWVQRGLAVAPHSQAILMASYSLHELLGEDDAAETQLERALDLSPANINILLTAARRRLKQGRINEAKHLLDQAQAIDPTSPSLLLAQAAWASKNRDADAILHAAKNMAKQAKDSDYALLASAAELFLSVGQIEEADKCIESLSIHTTRSTKINRWVHNLRGMKALLTGDPAQTVRELSELTNSTKVSVETLNLLARAYDELGDSPSAENIYRRILQLRPSSANAQLGLALALLRQARYDEAKSQISRIPADSSFDHNEARLITLASNLAQAAKATSVQDLPAALIIELKSLLSQQPTTTVHAKLIAHCLTIADFPLELAPLIAQRRQDDNTGWIISAAMGQYYLRIKEPGLALSLGQDIIQLSPQLPAGYDLTVRALASLGRKEDAIHQAVEAPLGDAQSCRMLSAIVKHYRLTNKPNDARQALDLAKSKVHDCYLLTIEQMRLLQDRSKIAALADLIRNQEGDDGLLWRFEKASALMRLTSPRESAAKIVALLDPCLTKRPGWVEARLMQAEAFQTLGRTDKAIDALQTALLHRPSLATGAAAIALATNLDKLGRKAQADAVLANVIQADPNNMALLKLQTSRYARTKDFNAAAAVAERVLSQDPSDTDWAATTALLQLQIGQAKRSEEILRTILASDPNSPSALWTLAQALLAQDRADEAVDSVRSVAQNNRMGELWLVLGQVMAELDRTDEAESACKRAQTYAKGHAQLLAACARFWGHLNNRDKQLELARLAVVAKGEQPGASLDLAAVLLDNGSATELEEARSILEKRLSADSSNVLAMWLKAKLLISQTPPDVKQAIDILHDTIRQDRDNPTPRKLLVRVLMGLSRQHEAARIVNDALTKWPSDVDLLIASAELSLQNGQDERAIPPLVKSNKISPRNPAIVALIAATYRNLSLPSQGIALVKQSIGDNQFTTYEMSALAQLYEAKGAISQAASFYEQAYQQADSLPRHLQSLISFYARHGDLSKVADLAVERTEAKPDDLESMLVAGQVLCTQSADPSVRQQGFSMLADVATHDDINKQADALYRTGLCHYAQGSFKQAESLFSQSHDLVPHSPQPINALAWLYTDNMNRPEDAKVLVESFLSAGGQATPQLLDTYGTCLLKLKKNNAAKTALTSAAAMAGQTETRTAAKYHLAIAEKNLGDHHEATSLLRQALALNDRVGGLSVKDRNHVDTLLLELDSRP